MIKARIRWFDSYYVRWFSQTYKSYSQEESTEEEKNEITS